MARYTGPNCRLCRQVGEKLFLKGERCFTPKCAVERRRRPPGPPAARRRRLSDRAVQLRAKQKARYSYGVLERQFHKYYEEALAHPGVTGQYLLQLLERRLDNVVYRLSFAESRKQAREWVRHGHFTVNGRRVNIPSYLVKEEELIAWKDSSQKKEFFKAATTGLPKRPVPPWLSLDVSQNAGKVLHLPEPSEIETNLEPRFIVEYYAR